MKIKALTIAMVASLAALLPTILPAVNHSSLGKPDLKAIKTASTDPNSEFYYPKLLKSFMANDTIMTDEQFQYFYYGTLFQEDYDPYRPTFMPKQLDVLKPIYHKEETSRAERQMVLDYAIAAIEHNPVNIQQLVHRVYTYEKSKKFDLAKIWQYKLNHILLVIASSGMGTDPETARVVVYPEHEYDFLNLAGFIATGQRFEAPYYDVITVKQRNANDPEGFYFDISEMLRQYFLKHPSELEDEESDGETDDDTEIGDQTSDITEEES